MKHLLILFSFFLVFSCKENDSNIENSSSVSNVSEFLKLTKDIKQLTFPYEITCFKEYDYSEINNDFIKYQPEGANLVGRVFSNDYETAILYTFSSDVVFPIVYIYSNEGTVERKKNVFDLHDCGFSEYEEMYVNCKLFNSEIIKTVEVNDLVQHTKMLNTDTIKLLN